MNDKVTCPACGTENPKGAKFCNNCGRKLSSESEPETNDIVEDKKEEESPSKDVAESNSESENKKEEESVSKIPDVNVQDIPQTPVNIQDNIAGMSQSAAPKRRISKGIKILIGIVAAAVVVVAIIAGVMASQPKIKYLKASYNGDTSADVVLDENNPGIQVAAYDKDDKKIEDVTGWTIAKPRTLKADSSSVVRIDYKDFSTKLSVKCSTSDPSYISMDYAGDTSDGTVIGPDNPDLTVLIHYKDGEVEQVSPDEVGIKNQTLTKDNTVTLTAEYEGLSDSIDIECSDKTPTSIEATYSGDTSEGVTIDSGDSDMDVTVTYADGTVETVTDWTVKEPVTLVAEQTSTVEIDYEGLTTTVDIQCTTQSPETFKASCQAIAYDDLLRNPDNYEGQPVKFTGEVLQVIPSDYGISSMLVYTAQSYGTYSDNLIYVDYPDSTGNFIKDDIVTLYGTSSGNYSYETALGSLNTVPDILAYYIDLN